MRLRKRQFANALTRPFGLILERRGSAWRLLEPEQLERFLIAFLVDCVFDVGANFGQYATRLRELGFKGLIVSFEPNPDIAKILRDTAARDEKWVVEELALDEKSRPLTFNIMKADQCSSLHEPDHTYTTKFIDANVVKRQVNLVTQTLETVFPTLQEKYKFTRPFLKMDTQGHDIAVAKGAGTYLKHFVGLQSELALTTLYKDQLNFNEALDFYRSAGFKLSALVPNNEGHFPDLYEIDSYHVQSSVYHSSTS